MNKTTKIIMLERPKTLKQVADEATDLQSFGYNLRDWQHEIERLVTSRSELAKRIQEAPASLADKFEQGEVADAYLAAYAEWLAQQAKLTAPLWAKRRSQPLVTPWYADSDKKQLEASAPESFRKRRLFTIPDNVFRPRRGRPRVSEEAKRLKAIERQRAYRKRIKTLIEKARTATL